MTTLFNKVLKGLREARGYSIKDMADRMGIDPSRYSHIENPDPEKVKSTKEETLLRIQQALELTEAESLRLFFAAGRIPSSMRDKLAEETTANAVSHILDMPIHRVAGLVSRWNKVS